METKRRMNQILARHTGKSEEEVEKATSYDHYYSPEEVESLVFVMRLLTSIKLWRIEIWRKSE